MSSHFTIRIGREEVITGFEKFSPKLLHWHFHINFVFCFSCYINILRNKKFLYTLNRKYTLPYEFLNNKC